MARSPGAQAEDNRRRVAAGQAPVPIVYGGGDARAPLTDTQRQVTEDPAQAEQNRLSKEYQDSQQGEMPGIIGSAWDAWGRVSPIPGWVDSATGRQKPGAAGGGMPGASPKDAAYQASLNRQRDADIEAARRQRDKLLGEGDAQPREAPQVGAPAPITAAHAAGPGEVRSSYDSTAADEARAKLQAYQDRLALIAEGKAGASAAELAGRRLNAQAIAQQYSLAARYHGYSGAGLRAAQRNAAGMAQTNIAQTAELRAKEQADARAELGRSISEGRGQDITQAGQRGQQDLDAARANQTAKLQTDLTNAGFDQRTIEHMSDQELQVKLANAGFRLTQQQIDDLRWKNQRDQQLTATGQVMAGSSAAAAGERERELKLLEIRQRYEEAKANKDAAGMQMWATMAQEYIKSPSGQAQLASLSDRREKTDIRRLPAKDSEEFLDALANAYRYKYKDPKVPGAAEGEHVGPMAQDLETTRIGKTIVETGPDGRKRVDTGRLTLALGSVVAGALKTAEAYRQAARR